MDVLSLDDSAGRQHAALCRRDRPRRRALGSGARSLALILALLGGGACGEPTGASTPARQQLHEALVPVFELVNDQRFEEARALLAGLPGGGSEASAYQAVFLLGYSYHKQKLYAEASEHFERAIALQPDYHPPHHFLGFAHYYLGELPQARRAFEAHRALRPGEGDDEFGLGLCDLDEGRLTEAERHLRAAVAQHEAAAGRGADRRREVAKCRARLGDVFEARGELQAARSEYEQALSLWPPHYEVWHKLYRVLVRLDEEDLAAIALQRHEEWRARRTGSP